MHNQKKIKFFHTPLFLTYLTLIIFFSLTKGYNNQIVQSVVNSISGFIPSINVLSVISPNPQRTSFDLSLAWIFSLASPIFFIRSIDWNVLDKRHAELGGPFIASFVLAFCGLFILAMFAYPLAPSDSKRGMLIAIWFKMDLSFIWGCVLILVVGFGWSCLVGSCAVLYRKYKSM